MVIFANRDQPIESVTIFLDDGSDDLRALAEQGWDIYFFSFKALHYAADHKKA